MFVLLINTVLSPNGVHFFSLKKESAECLAKKTWRKAESHSKKLFPAIESVFAQTKKTWDNLDAIFVVNGPGPFTSLRVGIAVANSAGFALNIPVYSVPNVIPDSTHGAKRNASSLQATAPDQESLKRFFSQYLVSKIPEIKQEKAFHPIAPIYGREPNISKPRQPLTVMTLSS